MTVSKEIIIAGGGIAGLTLALSLHKHGIPFKVFEAVTELKPLGVGLNLLPHAMKELTSLGLDVSLIERGIETKEVCFFTGHGQLVFTEARGRAAGYNWPQLSIHRGDLHKVLLDAVRERAGDEAIKLGHKCVKIEQDSDSVTAHFVDPTGAPLPSVRGSLAISCEGVNSPTRVAMHPREAVPRYEGTTSYRGTTVWKPFLSGASMFYLGTREAGKLVMYPIRNNVDAEGRQLLNWVVEVARPGEDTSRDWNREADISEFISAFEHCKYDWLDIPAVLRAADKVYQYPLVDQDPLPFWSQGRVTLLGDAAHPMMPRGSNGASQAILDVACITSCLLTEADPVAAFKAYELARLEPTKRVVLANRDISPDAVLRLVESRTGGKRFDKIEDVISKEELASWQERYRQIAGFSVKELNATGADKFESDKHERVTNA